MVKDSYSGKRSRLAYQTLLFFSLCVCMYVCVLFRATSAAYGDSQARGLIGTVAAGLRQSHSNARSKLCL